MTSLNAGGSPGRRDADSIDECDSRTQDNSNIQSTVSKGKKKRRHRDRSRRHRPSTSSLHDLVVASSKKSILREPPHQYLGLPFPIKQMENRPDVGTEFKPETEDFGLSEMAPQSNEKLDDQFSGVTKTSFKTKEKDPFLKREEKFDVPSETGTKAAIVVEDESDLLQENAPLAAMLNDFIKFFEIVRRNGARLDDNESDGEANPHSPETSRCPRSRLKSGQHKSPSGSYSPPSSSRYPGQPPPISAASSKSPRSPKPSCLQQSPKFPTKRSSSSRDNTDERIANAPLIRFSRYTSSATLVSTETIDNNKNTGELQRSQHQDQSDLVPIGLASEPFGQQTVEAFQESNQVYDTALLSIEDRDSSQPYPNNGNTPTGGASKLSCWRELFSSIELVSKYIQTDCWDDPSDSSAPEVGVPPTARRSTTKNFNNTCCLQISMADKRESEESSGEELDRAFASYSAAREVERARTDVKAVVHDRRFNNAATFFCIPVYDWRHL
ncbi:unnamed protein product [Ixodes persulcatus]